MTEHRCYLQVAKTPEELRRECCERYPPAQCGFATGWQTLHANTEETDDGELILPSHVFFNIESMQVDGCCVPNFMVGEMANDH